MNAIENKKFKCSSVKGDIAVGGILLALGLLLCFWLIPNCVEKGFSNTSVTPRTFPTIIAIILACFGAWILYRGIIALKKGETGTVISFSLSSFLLGIIGIAYAVLFEIVGYIPLNIICIPVVYYMFGGRKILEAILVAVIFTAISVLFFYGYLKLVIPLVWW